jgi:nitrite reductase/ring-hydroxylating ferredoxin subunit
MYLSIDAPTRSLRTAPGEQPGTQVLLVGGNGHVVGRARDTGHRVDDLEGWTKRWFPGAEVTHRWSAQDYAPAAGLPLVGVLPGSRGRVFVATGYHKWGMTNGVAAALRLVAALDDDPRPEWGSALDRASAVVGLPGATRFSAEVGVEATRGWLGAEARTLPKAPPAEGKGVVGRSGVQPAAVSTVGGTTCRLSAVCTHLGGVVTWNEAERSWDCPLHGSRFAADGRVLEGPATTDLAVLD